MYKAKHIAWYYNLFPRINPSFSYCNRVSLFSVTHYILVIYKPLPIFQHLYYFAKPILLHCSIISPYHSHRCLYEHCQNFKLLAMLKSTNNLLFISLLDLAYLLFSFVICSSLRRCSSPFGGSQRKLGMCKGEVTFVSSISARVARTVFCSSFVRLSYKLSISTLFHSLAPIC